MGIRKSGFGGSFLESLVGSVFFGPQVRETTSFRVSPTSWWEYLLKSKDFIRKPSQTD